jgi:hypothetical protein
MLLLLYQFCWEALDAYYCRWPTIVMQDAFCCIAGLLVIACLTGFDPACEIL